jgi:hypothetical protein
MSKTKNSAINPPSEEEIRAALLGPNGSIVAFLKHEHITTENGLELDWRDHEFMIDVYEDMYRLEKNIVGLKAAQITFTTTACNAVLCIAKNKGYNIIYTLPTFDDVRVFSGGKVNRIIAQNPVYQSWVANKDAMEQKIVGNNIIHFRGTHSQKAATMIPSDLNVYDEVDSSNQEVIEQYSTRLQHSTLKREWWFSHPSVPGNGVDRHWPKSDQKHWFIKCPACKKWQYMKWPESVDLKREVYQCRYCHAELSNNVRREGHWVRKYLDRPYSGYWIPLLICPWVPASEIIGYYYNKSSEYFFNKVLGLPYIGGGNKLVREQMMQNITNELFAPNNKERVILGVDTGLKLDYVLGTAKHGLFFHGDASDYDELDRIMERWPKCVAIVDGGGDIIGSRKFRERWPGRVWLCFMGGDKPADDDPKWDDDKRSVVADRNKMIQMVVDEFREKRIPLQGSEADWNEYYNDWNNLYRTTVTDATTGQFKGYRWIRVARDHRALATVNWRVGIARFSGLGFIHKPGFDDVKPDSYYVTPDGKTEVSPLAEPLKKAVNRFDEEEEEGEWRL